MKNEVTILIKVYRSLFDYGANKFYKRKVTVSEEDSWLPISSLEKVIKDKLRTRDNAVEVVEVLEIC